MNDKKRIRILSLLLVLAMVASFAACGTGTTNTSSAASASAAQTTEAAATESTAATNAVSATASTTEAPATDTATASGTETTSIFPLDSQESLTMFYPWSPRFVELGYASPNDFTFYAELEKLTNVHIDFTAVGADVVQEKFQLMMATQDYTDMFYNCLAYYAGGVSKAIDDDAFIDLTAYEDLMPNYISLMEEDPDFKRVNYTDEGYLGQFMDYGENVVLTQGFVVRQDWLDAQKLDMPTTYDQWFDVLTAFKDAYGLENTMMEKTPTSGFYEADSDDYYVDNGEVKYIWTDRDTAVDYLTVCKKWYDAGLFTASALVTNGITDSDQRAMKVNGETGIFKVDIDDVGTYNNETGQGEEYHIVGIANPVQNEGDQPYGNIRQDSYSDGMTISSACSNIDLAVQWLDNFYTQPVELLANYGIEDDTFTYDDAGQPHFTTKVLDDPDGLNMALFKYVMDWGPTVLDWSRKNDSYDEIQQACLEIWSDRDTSKAYPTYASFTTEESTEVSDVQMDIATYVDEQIPKFIMGDLSLDDYQSFVDQLTSMGMDTILTCRQAAYDRYQAR